MSSFDFYHISRLSLMLSLLLNRFADSPSRTITERRRDEERGGSGRAEDINEGKRGIQPRIRQEFVKEGG